MKCHTSATANHLLNQIHPPLPIGSDVAGRQSHAVCGALKTRLCSRHSHEGQAWGSAAGSGLSLASADAGFPTGEPALRASLGRVEDQSREGGWWMMVDGGWVGYRQSAADRLVEEIGVRGAVVSHIHIHIHIYIYTQVWGLQSEKKKRQDRAQAACVGNWNCISNCGGAERTGP